MLTDRESEVLLLLAAGYRQPQIALRLGISVHSVGTHLENCYRKLDAHSAAHALTRAHELDLLAERVP